MSPKAPTRPMVGFSPAMPQNAAGSRIDPPASVPSAPRQSPAATAAPDPLEDPPVIRPVFHGLSAGGKGGSVEGRPPKVNS